MESPRDIPTNSLAGPVTARPRRADGVSDVRPNETFPEPDAAGFGLIHYESRDTNTANRMPRDLSSTDTGLGDVKPIITTDQGRHDVVDLGSGSDEARTIAAVETSTSSSSKRTLNSQPAKKKANYGDIHNEAVQSALANASSPAQGKKRGRPKGSKSTSRDQRQPGHSSSHFKIARESEPSLSLARTLGQYVGPESRKTTDPGVFRNSDHGTHANTQRGKSRIMTFPAFIDPNTNEAMLPDRQVERQTGASQTGTAGESRSEVGGGRGSESRSDRDDDHARFSQSMDRFIDDPYDSDFRLRPRVGKKKK